ncbi:MAG: hypothetical protein HRT79_14025 [Halomonas sp.]|nr:hypothetical protein [Halomonas sp.]NQY71618.1 hypothetical protein [Halomonas sp.]
MISHKGRQVTELLIAQLSSPAARIIFSLLVVPAHPKGGELLQVVVLSEVLSIFLTGGRNYLIQAGFNHKIFPFGLDRICLLALSCIAFNLLATDAQLNLVYSVVVATSAITLMTMLNAAFLRKRRLVFILPCNVMVYFIISLSVYAGIVAAFGFFILWLGIEFFIKSSCEKSRYGFIPMLAVFMSFMSQKMDIQLAAYFNDSRFLFEIFQLNAFFMPMALFVRVIGNTALLRGETIISASSAQKWLLGVLGVGYGFGLYITGITIGNSVIVDNIIVLTASCVFGFLTLPYRERIAVCSRRGDFSPLLILSFCGFVPALFYYFSFVTIDFTSQSFFLFFIYLLPRLLMYIYGRFFFKERFFKC